MDFDFRAEQIVINYISDHLDKSDAEISFDVYIVWKCKTLQNWKYLLSSTLLDGMYYELTYNGDEQEWYLDAYKKFENRVIPKI
jgi:hypothetical protein